MKATLPCLILLAGSSALAQSRSVDHAGTAPAYEVAPVSQRATVFHYRHETPISVDFAGTWLLPKAHGEALVSGSQGNLRIEAKLEGLSPASRIGPAYLTYVLWAVGSDGQFQNMGEVLLIGTTGQVAATTKLPAFAMLVTAEPYFAVTEPSNAVIMRNTARDVALRYRLAPDMLPLLQDRKTPLDLYQARNAVRIARRLGAERLASEALDKALALLRQAEHSYRQDDLFATVYKAREATEAAEAARVVAARNQGE